MDRTTSVKKGILAGILNNVLAIILPFVSRTIIIYSLGNAYVGLSGVFASILQVLNITELGFGSAISYLLYKPIADKDTDRICQLLSFARLCFRIIGVAVLLLGIAIIPFIDKMTMGGRPPEMNVYILYILYLANSVVSYFLFSYKRILFSACQRYDIETNINTVTVICQYILQIIVLLLTQNYYLYVVMMIIASIANNLLCQYATRKNYPEYVCRGSISKEDKAVLIKTMKGVFASKIGSTAFSSTTNIIVSSFFGLVVLGQFTNYNYIATSLIGLFAVVHNSLRPSIGNYKILETKENNYRLLDQITVLYNWIAAFCTCCLVCLLQDFIYLWLGNDSMFPQFYVILFAATFYFGRLNCVPNIYVEAAGLWYESKYIFIIAAIANVALGVLFVYILGLPGILIASMSTSLLVCAGGFIYVLFHYYFNSSQLAMKYCKVLVTHFIVQALIIVIIYKCSLLLSASSWSLFFMKTILVALSFLLLLVMISLLFRDKTHKYYIYAKSFIRR